MNYEVTNACNGHQLSLPLESLYPGFFGLSHSKKLTTLGIEADWTGYRVHDRLSRDAIVAYWYPPPE